MSISTLKSCCFNTASGTDCMQSAVAFEDKIDLSIVSIPQAVRIACNLRVIRSSLRNRLRFQYRKRYGLHAMGGWSPRLGNDPNWFQYRKRYGLHAITSHDMNVVMNDGTVVLFQYRKRYGLHAILSPEALGNSEPKRWFSNTPSLFALFPKPQGIFLSQKAAQKGCEASNTKETFIHEENLKLMAISRKSRTSL